MKAVIPVVLLTAAGLIPAALSDAKTRDIPDWVNLPILAAGLLRLVMNGGWKETLLFLGAMLLFFVVMTLLRFDAMGGGDMKILLSLALVFGLWGSLAGLFLSCVAALLYCLLRKVKRFPMGPFLLLGYGVTGIIFLILYYSK